ncbi:hypothetical protein [uncultured Prevotella sp.]|jgi:hypothetical protein|uniref:hypothetical protein n=1 Tax=uncultured Prevotella sp. TaxID=159272 RepID=UPI0025908A53|nr:hypothetical protein [uncultured Prevotella sp.]
MGKRKSLLVTAKYGSLDFHESAHPYDENAQDEQVETCVKSIRRQISDAGLAEMMDTFQLTSDLIE